MDEPFHYDPYINRLAAHYPGRLLTVHVRRIPTWTDKTWLEDILASECSKGVFSWTESGEGVMLWEGQLAFESTEDADRTIAVMNMHPILSGFGITFCHPDHSQYPDLRSLYTHRIIQALERARDERGDLLPPPPREGWMDYVPTWPGCAPSPYAVYDFCRQFGPIHHVYVFPDDSPFMWRAVVQFFDASDADKYDECYEPMLGWKEDHYVTGEDETWEMYLPTIRVMAERTAERLKLKSTSVQSTPQESTPVQSTPQESSSVQSTPQESTPVQSTCVQRLFPLSSLSWSEGTAIDSTKSTKSTNSTNSTNSGNSTNPSPSTDPLPPSKSTFSQHDEALSAMVTKKAADE